ncbi:MAG: macrolide ABC transporter ATP-binding protein [Candidatus Yanofskybacteria bacterium RIFCSPHIGHO2_01_FULL_39_8b]|uniref:Macrolide ABC transporter ATP-binding protein n=1 Tax=Candidatus Yanofskybacteria bacterium RIFCSPHIGHO2_01_FULL_39_8b TaxID=1802659 RepID=A0A1F8E9Y6_9BACT|nr:MAG: macrolide ABC transporter ATP-binding protein [Candidatus Yanofskybacteria bacterium RIFCSPHIGHO2_01_FULL_39_8b]
MALIEIKNLSKIYRDNEIETVGLNNISLKIDEGEFVAIMGPSGSGKSTLLQILGCLDRPTSGQYLIDGKFLDNYTDNELAKIRNKKMGFVFQAFNLLPRLSVLENVKLPLIYGGYNEPERNKIAFDMIKLVGLEDRINYKTSKLSGGQKQRVAVARALANNPRVVFADEPTGNLDSKSGEIILDFFQELNDKGHTVVVVTHESYVAQSAKRIIQVRDGRIESDVLVKDRRIIKEDGLIK